MNASPTLAELRARVFKHSGSSNPEIGNWLARRIGRPSAVYGTWIGIRLGVSAHTVTLAAVIANLGAAVAIGTGSRAGFLVGVTLLVLAYWLDHVDGQIARWRGTSCVSGVYFDYMLHHAAMMSLGFALGFGLTMQGGSPLWSLAGFLIAAGWTFLNLHNDCRYKAFFQRLKRDERSYRIQGGSGGRPLPPPGWPRRWPGIVSWPVSKACEPHVVLMALVFLMSIALASPRFWLLALKVGVAVMAVIAPSLATVRAAKAILRDEPDREFDRWFQPEDEVLPEPCSGDRMDQNTPRGAHGGTARGMASCPRSVA